MIRIGYAPGAYDLFHIGHLNLLRRAREHCEYLTAGVVADEVLIGHKGVTPVFPLAGRVEIVRNVRFVDATIPALTNDKVEIWKDLRFNELFKGNDWQGTEKGNELERDFTALGVEVVYFPYTLSASSSALRRTLQNMDALASIRRVAPFLSAWPKRLADPSERGHSTCQRRKGTRLSESRRSWALLSRIGAFSVITRESTSSASAGEEGSAASEAAYTRGLAETRRLEAFSDGAFSIIITLLVLEIHRPNAAPGRLGEELLLEWSSYLAYALAFIYVGVIWLNHHYMFERLCKVDMKLNESRHHRHGFPDSVSDGCAGGSVSRRYSHRPESGGRAVRLDRESHVGRLAACLHAPSPASRT